MRDSGVSGGTRESVKDTSVSGFNSRVHRLHSPFVSKYGVDSVVGGEEGVT